MTDRIPKPEKTVGQIIREIGAVLLASAIFALPAWWAAGPWPALTIFTALAASWIITLALKPDAPDPLDDGFDSEAEGPDERGW